MSDSATCRFEAVVQPDGTLKPVSAAVVRPRLMKWAGQRVQVEVERDKKRTSPQNRLLFGIVYEDLLNGLRELAVEAGGKCPFRTKLELHEAMKHIFVGPTVIYVPGVGEMELEPRTRDMPPERFSLFIQQVSRWGAERGIYVRNGYEEWSA